MDGQQLVNTLEKFVPHLLEPYHTSNAIKQRLQHLIDSNKEIDDLREIEAWFAKKDYLMLSEEEMNFLSLQILNYFFKNPSIRFHDEKINWDILSWLTDLKGSASVLSKYLTSYIEDFPYYDRFRSTSLLVSFLKTLKRIKETYPSIYESVKVPTSLFFSKIKKSIDILGYPYNRSILVYLMEDSDALSDFHSDEAVDLPEKYVLPVLIGMRSFDQAKSYLTSKMDPERFFAESFCFSMNSVLGEFRYQTSQVLSKFAEFVEKSELASKILQFIPSNYRVLLSLCLRKKKELLKMLNSEDTFFEIYNGNYLPRAYRIFIGKPQDFFALVADVSVPVTPEVYYEMSELSYEMKDFDESLRLINIALKNTNRLKRDWLEKFIKHHKARCLFELKRYSKALEILEALIEEDKSSASFYYSLYEACKKAIGTNRTKK